jgi:tryptophanyl-tRNA synthetase
VSTLEPFREKRGHLEEHPDEVKEILTDGERRARSVAIETMNDVRRAMQLG